MFQLPDGDDAARVADWVELELCAGELSIAKSKVASLVEQSSGSEPGEAFLSDVWRHLRQRQERYSTTFYELHGSHVERRDDVHDGQRVAYETCLFFSLFGASAQHRSDPKLFERLTAEAVRNYVGGESFVFGWPVLPDIQVAIAARVQQVAIATRERFVEAPAERYKDRGVDIITWKPFEEPNLATRRTCQYVLLSQCAAGRDWRGKTRELPIKSWTQYIHWAADPCLSFAVSCVIGDDLWHDIAREVDGIVFDRIRLLNLLPEGVSDTGLGGEMLTWTLDQREEWRV